MDISRFLNQDVTVWEAGEPDMYGKPSYTPRHTRGRIETLATISGGADGVVISSTTTVYLSEAVSNGDYVYNGISEDVVPHSEAYRIEKCDVVPSISASQELYKVTV